MNEGEQGFTEPTVTFAGNRDLGKRVLFGRYELLEPIGRGGIGEVHRAIHTSLKRTVALKLLQPRHAGVERFDERFRREMEAAGRIDHPNVVRALDAGEEEGTLFLVMDFVEGKTLDGILQRHKVLPHAQACAIILQAALGLEAIHHHQLVHRDLKPANLMVSRGGVVKILDLGLARLKDHEGREDLTPSHCLLGTPNYQAPEQANNPHAADIRADIYSLGCTLFKLLTGGAPYASPEFEAIQQKLRAHAESPLPPTPNLPPALRAVLETMTAKDPARRFQSPQHLITALTPFAGGSPLCLLVAPDDPRPASFHGHSSRPEEQGQGNCTTKLSSDSTPSQSTPGVPHRPFPWLVAGATGAGLALALTVAGMLVDRGRREPLVGSNVEPTSSRAPEAPRTFELVTRDLDPCEPLLWHDLLDREPIPFIWQEGDGQALRVFNARANQFTVNATRNAVFLLGTTKKSDYTYKVNINQTTWTRGAGLFLGLQAKSDTKAEYQYLVFRSRTNEVKGGLDFSVDRGLAEPFKKVDGTWSIPTRIIATRDIMEPFGEQCLEVKVVGGNVLHIRLNDVELKELVTPYSNSKFVNHQIGGLGTLNVVNSCIFRDAKFKAHAAR